MGAPTLALIEPDPFLGTSRKQIDYIPNYYKPRTLADDIQDAVADAFGMATTAQKLNDTFTIASRPINGIAVKPDTFAVVRVVKADGTEIALFNRLSGNTVDDWGNVTRQSGLGGTPIAHAWTDWLLTSVHEERAEKTQIVETFGNTYLYAFGERPRVLSFTGILFNTEDYNWRAVFWENWDKFFRATKLVELDARMYIMFDDILVEGYPLQASADQSANNNSALTFSFNFFVTNYTNVTAAKNFAQTQSSAVALIKAGYNGGEPSFSALDSRKTIADLLSFGTGLPIATALVDSLNIAVGITNAHAIASDIIRNAERQLAYWEDLGINYAERAMGLQSGELATWYGYLSGILALQAKNAGPGSTYYAANEINSADWAEKLHDALGPAMIPVAMLVGVGILGAQASAAEAKVAAMVSLTNSGGIEV